MKLPRRKFLKLGLSPFVPLLASGKFLPDPVERFVIISDTHQLFNQESLALLNILKQRSVDFIIVAGDVSEILCGPDWLFECVNGSLEAGWQWTRQRLDGLGKPWVAVPGNHDLISSKSSVFDPPDPEALALWQKYVGSLGFAKETGYCKIVGVNYLDWDFAWLDSQLATMKHKIVVSHLPLFGVDPALRDQDAPAKIDWLIGRGVRWFICGHQHQFSAARVGPLIQVVCPSATYIFQQDFPFPVENGLLPTTIPTRGWLEIEASAMGLKIELWRSDGQKLLDGWQPGCELFLPVIYY